MPRPLPIRLSFLVALSSLVASLVLRNAANAQEPVGKKYALLVGVLKYEHDSLPDLKHTENDVEELEQVLFTAGYRVVILTTTRGKKAAAARPTARNIRSSLKCILDKVTKHDTVLVALAGHGVQLKVTVGKIEKEESFFCPADAKPRDTTDLKRLQGTMIPLKELFKELEDSGAGVKLMLVDACRNNPREGRNVNVDNLPRPSRGTAALFSCKSGERAFETDKLPGAIGHGVFFYHVLQGLKGKAKNDKKEITWSRLAEYVTDKVSDDVPMLIGQGAKQTPHEIKNLTGKSPILVGLEITNSIQMILIPIPPGKFTMGSPAEEKGRGSSEKQHEVEITKEFLLGIHEVTQKQFKAVMKYNPSYFSTNGEGRKGTEYKSVHPTGGKVHVVGKDTSDFPVENVSHDEAVEFCKKLTAMAKEKASGRTYRLPTEAEWEYACRGGAPSYQIFHLGNSLSSSQANFNGNFPYGDAGKGGYLQRTCKVGTVGSNNYEKNGFGLYDMHGNVFEWCSDWYAKDAYGKSPRKDPTGPARVIRGGGWSNGSLSSRSASRSGASPGLRVTYLGFRVAAVLLK